MTTSIPGYHESGAVQWLRGSGHQIQPLLRPPPQTPQVLSDTLAAPRPDCVWTHPALRTAAPGGWVEVSATVFVWLRYMYSTRVSHGAAPLFYFFLKEKSWVGKANGDVCLSRYDLRIRYIPSDFMERFKDDKTTMLYFYQQVSNICVFVFRWYPCKLLAVTGRCVCAYPQVRSDYMQQYASKVSDGMALQLGCLEIR